MDLIRYIKFYYFNENPEWFVQRASFYHPKPLADILTNIGVNICFFITFVIIINLSIYGVCYLLNMICQNKQDSKKEVNEDKKQSEDEEKVEKQKDNEKSKTVNESLAQGEGKVLLKDEPQAEDKPEEKGDASPRAH